MWLDNQLANLNFNSRLASMWVRNSSVYRCHWISSNILASLCFHVYKGGNRANTLHYINNNQLVNDGELVLMDAGCEYHGYTSDITRTWPVSGAWTVFVFILDDNSCKMRNLSKIASTQNSYVVKRFFEQLRFD